MLLGLSVAAHNEPVLAVTVSIVALVVAPSLALRVMIAVAAATAFFAPWPIPALAGFVAWWLVQRLRHDTRSVVGPAARPAPVCVLILVVAGSVAGGLAVAVSWERIAGEPLLLGFHRPPWAVFVLLVLTVAIANALAEELFWRQAVLTEQRSSPAVVVGSVQALAFGLAHWNGLPYGWSGVILASLFSLGLMGVRLRWGFPAALLTHFAADIVIVASVLATAIYPPV